MATDGTSFTRYILRCASCGKTFDSVRLYTGGGPDWLHDVDEEGSAACGPVLAEWARASPVVSIDDHGTLLAMHREAVDTAATRYADLMSCWHDVTPQSLSILARDLAHYAKRAKAIERLCGALAASR